MTFVEEGKIEIHTENIFPIIKKAVYSDHEIFLRELVSNGVDAINKRRMAAMAGDCEEGDEGRINIYIDRESKTLKISDNGIGMTSDEVKRYINQVAFSSAAEFLEKYKKENQGIIGHFGLGFYSSFMVSKKVEILTRSSISKSESVKWTCDGSPSFKIENSDKEEIGTEVILHLMDEEIEFIEPSRIKSLITKYCDFMPVEVFLDGESINKRNPPWKKSFKDMKDEDYIKFYNYLYPFQGDPLLWVHLNTDYPYNLQGILFFPKTTGRADWEKGEIKLYCNQVFVSDSIKEVVPSYLLPLRGVIDSPDIPLNVSRSALQTDRKVRSIGNFVSKKIADKLKSIKENNPNLYAEIWDSISPFIKIGAMEDEKFSSQVEQLIIYPSTLELKEETKNKELFDKKNNKSYTTLSDYINRLENDNKERVLYCTDEIAQANALNVWIGEGKEVLFTDSIIDTQFLPWVESKNENVKFQRVDSELDPSLKNNEVEIIDKEGESKSETIRRIISEAIGNDKLTVQVQALKVDRGCPSMILLPEQMRRINDIGALMNQKLPGLPDHHVLLINQNHSLVEGLLNLNSSAIIVGVDKTAPNEELSKEIANHLYDMAKLTVGGLDPKEIADLQNQSADLMGKLIKKAL